MLSGSYEHSFASEGSKSFDGRSIEEVCLEVDRVNAAIEEINYTHSTTKETHQINGHSYKLYIYKPATPRMWHYKDDLGRTASKAYPKILFVHGVASDHTYFSLIKNDLNKLGIEVAAIDLPTSKELALDFNGLMDLHVSAVEDAYRVMTLDGNIVTLAGQSRGALVTTLAAAKIQSKQELPSPGGIIAMAPAGYDSMKMKQIFFGALKLGGLAFNALASSNKKRGYQLGRMIIGNAVQKPLQTYTECRQALQISVSESVEQWLSDVPIFVPTGTRDEFVDHDALLRLAKRLPNGNLSIATYDVNHMLDVPDQKDEVSLADIRKLSGAILAWQQSQMPEYTPLVYKDGEPPKRL